MDDKFKIDTSDMVDLVEEEKKDKKFKKMNLILKIVIILGFIIMICLYIFLSMQLTGLINVWQIIYKLLIKETEHDEQKSS